MTASRFVAAFASVLLAGSSLAHADTGFWAEAGKPFAETTIRGVSESTPPSNYVKDVIAPQFTKDTGIKVEFETTSWDQMYDKAIKDMEAKTGLYDFVYIEQDIIYSYLSRNFLVDITKSLKDDPKIADPSFNTAEFTSFIDYFKDPKTQDLYGVPMEAFVKVYLYRKDLFGDASVVLVPLPGHTPGLLGALVSLDRDGQFLLASDAISVRQSLDTDVTPRNTWNVEALLKSFEEVRRIERSGATVICGHDDLQWQSLRKGNEGYE